mgnify:CR=1 FL=1
MVIKILHYPTFLALDADTLKNPVEIVEDVLSAKARDRLRSCGVKDMYRRVSERRVLIAWAVPLNRKIEIANLIEWKQMKAVLLCTIRSAKQTADAYKL